MKKVGVPDTPLSSALATSSAHPRGMLAAAQLVQEAVDVEPELLGVAGQIVG